MAKGSFKTPAYLFAWYLANPAKPVLIGEVESLTNGDQTLKYAASWLESGFPISDDMPLTAQKYSPRHRRERLPGVPGALDDSLPDRWGEKVIRYLYKRGATIRDNLYFSGDDRFGAIGISDSDAQYRPFNLRPLPRLSDVEELGAAAAIIESGTGELAEHRVKLISAGGSLGGAKPKAVITIEGDEWVVKFFNGEPWDQPLIEHACLTMALKAQINVAQSRIIKMKAENAIAIKRFDRAAGQRIHSISASTLIRAATPAGQVPQYGYPHLARRLRVTADINRLDEHLEDLFRRMVFNILIGNTDDHEKNHAVTYEIQGGVPVVNLSKAYDVVTTGSGSTVHEFMIADDVVDPDLDAAVSVHNDFGLEEMRARVIMSDVILVVDQWKTIFAGLGVTEADIERLEEFIDADHLLEQRNKHRVPAKVSPKASRTAIRRTPKIFK